MNHTLMPKVQNIKTKQNKHRIEQDLKNFLCLLQTVPTAITEDGSDVFGFWKYTIYITLDNSTIFNFSTTSLQLKRFVISNFYTAQII